MKWATWRNIGIDRMGCAWLIRNYIDAHAEFVFVPEGDAPPFGDAEPFDVPGVRLSHHGGHCTFYTLLREYKLDDPVLERIARIIDEADTVQAVALEPAAVGLDLICRGICLTSVDAYAAMRHSALVYDALYAQLRSEEAGA